MIRFLLGVLLFLGVAVVLQRIVTAAPKKRRARLQAMAAQVGLTAVETGALGLPTGRTAGARQERASRERGLSAAMTAAMGSQDRLTGQWNGRSVSIDRLPGIASSLAVRTPLRTPLPFDWTMSGRRARFTFHPSGAVRVQSGNDEVDHRIEVRGKEAARLEALLRNPGVQRALLDAVVTDESAAMDRVSVFVARDADGLGDPTVAREALDTVTRIADAIDTAFDAAAPA